MYVLMHAARALRQGGTSCGGFRLGRYICHTELTLDLDDGLDLPVSDCIILELKGLVV